MVSPAPGDVVLMQFAKAPVPGKVKTRMLPALSAEKACQLHEELLLWTARTLVASRLGQVELWVTGDGGKPLLPRETAIGAVHLRQQSGNDLGQRMYGAFTDGLQRAARVLLVGSDCPAIDADYLKQALVALDNADVVLGPANDGGYVLIGAKTIDEAVFTGVDWGSSRVFAQTVSALDGAGLSWAALTSLADIDRPEDLPAWRALRGGEGPEA